MPIKRFIWGDGLSDHAWRTAEDTGAAWVGNNASAHISLLRATVAEELAFGMEQRGIPREQMAPRVAEALRTWGLEHVAEQDPMRLSTGQTRRMAIAQALLTRPGALVLDCPLDGLDTAAVNQLAAVLSAYPGEVTVYDRRPSAVSDAAGEQFQLLDGSELVPAHIPEFDLPEFPPRGVAEAVESAERGTADANKTAQRGVADADRTALSIRDVRVRGLGPFSVDVPAGQVTHLAGANGCGKTSLLLAALGLVDYEGEITGGRLGWAPTALDQSFLRRRVIDEIAGDEGVLELFGLGKWAEEHPLDVPTSDRRLVLVAAAMVGEPDVLLLDEPTVGLDVAGHRKLLTGIDAYVRRPGAPAVLWTCHDQRVADAVSDRSIAIGEV